MKDAAADWFDERMATGVAHWGTGEGAGNNTNFTDRFKAQFCSDARTNSWYHDLVSLKQQSDESVDEYATKFKRLASRVNLTDANQKKRMFIMGLSPAIIPMVYADPNANLEEMITKAKNVEIGFNLATGSKPRKIESISVKKTEITPTVTNNELEELTKKMEQLSLNYANITAALLAQTKVPPQGQRRNNGPPRNGNGQYNNNNNIRCYNCNQLG